MSRPRPQSNPPAPDDATDLDHVAASWVARRDRGLTPAEQDEFLQWLAADPRHGERLARQQRGWNQLARLALWKPEHAADANPDVLAPAPPRPRPPAPWSSWPWFAGLAAAAAIGVGVFLSGPSAPVAPPAAQPAVASAEPAYRQQVLDDGSLVELNRGARVAVLFSAAERRVRLEQGEALFTVAKNPARPFVVEAAGVTVLAVGTAFNVKLGAGAVEVLVTEGQVQLDRPASPLPAPTLVAAGQHAAVPRAGAPAVAAVTREEIDRTLAWQPRLLEFASTPLAEVAAAFNRRNRVQLRVPDPALQALPIGASFRSDNVDGFVRLLEVSFGIEVERSGDTITLRRPR